MDRSWDPDPDPAPDPADDERGPGWLPLRLPARADTLDAWGERLADRLRGRPAADRLFYAASTAADHSLLWHALGVAQALSPTGRWRQAAEVSLVLGVESALVNGGLKSLFRRDRPPAHAHPHHLRQPRTSSFPSGHASSAVTAAWVLGRARPAAVPLLVPLAALVAWSRVHVRIHHASDVAGGLLAGAVIGRTASRLLDRR